MFKKHSLRLLFALLIVVQLACNAPVAPSTPDTIATLNGLYTLAAQTSTSAASPTPGLPLPTATPLSPIQPTASPILPVPTSTPIILPSTAPTISSRCDAASFVKDITIADGTVSSKTAKTLAVGLIEAVDILLIAVVAHIIGLGLFKLFVDPDLPLPAWLKIRDLDDLKGHLAGSVIAVLAVLFMREAVAWDGQRDLLQMGTAVALMIVALTIYLVAKKPKD